jgi:hypothetical protein
MRTREPVGDQPGAARARSLETRLVLLEELRQVATHLATADLLERRADRSASPALAAVLHRRAAARRRRAAQLRADLAAHGVPPDRLPPCR